MPIYEYKCLKCGHQFEVIQRFSDNPVEICPKCKKIDKIALTKDDKKIFCVSCDFEEYRSEIKHKD